MVTSQVTTSLMYIIPSDNFPKVGLGLLRCRRPQRGLALRHGWARSRALRLEEARGLSAAVRTDLGSCRLGNFNIWEVATWEI